ncbi:S9 family peptidase [Deinococcus peraridilitoris]|uniref:Dipeptidyl aminopeptidase/acylaminoacyl peptidase n=1 Tax=Deinococcus peraridilitoris (strain DSM 19664 / LMG 22246 / CIP 109416 / KR-200) TaxID=937777 RepID=L0A4S7_DEIPD|nr:S9 family peptidase [Deinococcus peraridilitoris]AFZ68888.1 dipeptidyl aminopeptidase/acylaminoacyl peptidase [Deinococcus peraridilitoris DSM 19664]
MLQPDSLLKFVFPSDPQVSPDGQQVAYVLTRIEEEDPRKPDPEYPKPRYKSAVYLGGQGGVRQLTAGLKRDSAPRWSPDGSQLLFVSDREDKPQLFVLSLSGGEARQLTALKSGVGEGQWSPDGLTVAFLSRGDFEDRGPDRGEARVVEKLRYKFNGAGFLPDKTRDLYLLNVESGEARILHAPPSEISDFVWKLDGSGLLFVSSVDEHKEALWESEVFDVNLSGEVRQLTRWGSSLSGLAVHPSGERFVAVGHPGDKRNTEDPHVFEFSLRAPDSAPRRLDAQVDFPVGNIVAGDCHVGSFPGRPVWLGDTLTLLYTVGGSCGLFELLQGDKRERVFHPGQVVAGFTANANGSAYLLESDHDYPEVYLNGKKITDLASTLGDFPRRRAERVTVQNEDGEIEGWVLRPELQGSPALLTIHGGPHTAYGHGFMHEFQLLAERGYAVCYCNPRGSVGYGQAWSEAIYGRWGSIDHADLLAFFDACLERFPDLDRARTAVMGGSYGGYMTNWIVGHDSRFRAAVTDRSICNLVAFNGTSDIAPRFWRDELGLEYIREGDIAGLWDMSPLKYVGQVRTPSLIIHSEEDHRCPVEQAEQWFTALKLLGVETRFVRFPGENHELSRSGRPDRRLARLGEYLAWLDRHLA